MFKQLRSIIYLSLAALALTMLLWACKKKDVYPGQVLPQITSLSPSSAIAGTRVIIKGSNLKNVDTVRFGTVVVPGFNPGNNTDTAITVTVPDSLPIGSTYIQVYLPNGKGYASAPFTVVLTPPVPKIDSVSPTTAFPGATVTISGTNFRDVTSVKFGQVVATFAHTLDTNGKLTAIVPVTTQGGSQYIYVTNANGTDSVSFNINLSPAVTGLSAIVGKTGDLITVTGTRFTTVNAVELGTTAVTYTVTNDSTLTFTVPSNAPTNSNITITNSFGTATSSQLFTVYGRTTPYVLYGDALAASWWIGGWSNTSNFSSTTTVESGSNAISLTYTGGYGGFQVGYNSPGVDLTNYAVVRISVFGGPGTDGKKLQLYFNGGSPPPNPVQLIIKEGAWTDFIIPLASLGSPTVITEFDLQEYSGNAPETIYLDNIGFY